ncbi:MAG: copper ion binding protein [Clostridiales bacterium]|jgi:copper chaperone|nr:copper ion binding protein [Clostridiales bacterium]
MEKSTIQVEGMACDHCVKAIQTAVGALAGVQAVAVDLAQKTVTVSHDAGKAPIAAIHTAIEDQGYEVISY